MKRYEIVEKLGGKIELKVNFDEKSYRYSNIQLIKNLTIYIQKLSDRFIITLDDATLKEIVKLNVCDYVELIRNLEYFEMMFCNFKNDGLYRNYGVDFKYFDIKQGIYKTRKDINLIIKCYIVENEHNLKFYEF